MEQSQPDEGVTPSKPCSKCGETKPLDGYYKDKTRKYGYFPQCKVCSNTARRERYAKNKESERKRIIRWQEENIEKRLQYQRKYNKKHGLKHYLKHAYNITLEEYREMLIAQGGVCGVCRKPPKQGTRLFVDHDHNTGRVRGLLCHACNSGIGYFHDTPSNMRAAARYLERSRTGDIAA